MEDKRSEILLESGTNELQILEFKMADQLFGINVAKVSEIQVAVPTTPMQKSHPDVEGIFRPRDEIIKRPGTRHFYSYSL